MTKTILVSLVLALASSMACSGGRAPATGRVERPSVLLIIIDDLGFRIGVYGHAARTPQMNRLAQRGRRFDHAYCQYPLCNPSRTSLMTGWRPAKTGVWSNLSLPRATLDEVVPLQEHFRANGYFTAGLGKVYHGRFEDEFRWDVAETFYDARDSDEAGEHWALWGATPKQDEELPDGRAASRAVELLEQKKDDPFFIAVGFIKPHSPWIAPEKYFRMYPPERVQLPPEVPNDLDDISRLMIQRGADDDIPPEKRREALAAYYASVSYVDAQLGVLLDALERLKLWERTVVVLLSDNGVHRGEHGLWRKMSLFEESARVPLIVVAPGLREPGTATDQLAELVDLYPTLVELCRLPGVEGLEGTSLVPLLENPSRAIKTAAFTATARRGRLAQSVRTDRYRFTEWPDGWFELYDHQTDPNEFNNVVGDPARARTVEEIKNLLRGGYAAARVR